MYDQAFKLGLWRQGFAAAIGMIGAVAMMFVMVLPASHLPAQGRCTRTIRSKLSIAALSRQQPDAGLVQPEPQRHHPCTAVINFFMVIILLPLVGPAYVGEVAPDAMPANFWPKQFDFTRYRLVFREHRHAADQSVEQHLRHHRHGVSHHAVCAVLAGYALVHLRPRGGGVVVAVLLVSLYFPVRVVSIISVYEIQEFPRPDQQHQRPHPALCHLEPGDQRTDHAQRVPASCRTSFSRRRRSTAPDRGGRCGWSACRWCATAWWSCSSSISSPRGASSCCARRSPRDGDEWYSRRSPVREPERPVQRCTRAGQPAARVGPRGAMGGLRSRRRPRPVADGDLSRRRPPSPVPERAAGCAGASLAPGRGSWIARVVQRGWRRSPAVHRRRTLLGTRLVPTGDGYGSQGDVPVHFGLAEWRVTVEVTFLSRDGRVRQRVKTSTRAMGGPRVTGRFARLIIPAAVTAAGLQRDFRYSTRSRVLARGEPEREGRGRSARRLAPSRGNRPSW